MSRIDHIFKRQHGVKRPRRVIRRYIEIKTFDLTDPDPRQGDPWWRAKHGRSLPSDQAKKELRMARRKRFVPPPLPEKPQQEDSHEHDPDAK